jgi:hypothetical protein
MMLWLLNEHHVLPGDYYRLPAGEKDLLRILYQKIMESRSDL